MEFLNVLLLVFGAAGGIGGITALFMVRAQKRKLLADTGKTEAEADSVTADASSKRTNRESRILEMQQELNEGIAARLARAEEKADRLTEYVETLVAALREAGVAVPPMPKKMTDDVVHHPRQD